MRALLVVNPKATTTSERRTASSTPASRLVNPRRSAEDGRGTTGNGARPRRSSGVRLSAISADGKTILFGYGHAQSDLYLAQGLR